MKRVLFFFALFISASASAQVMQADRVYGRHGNRYAADSAFRLPKVQGTIAGIGQDTGLLRYNKADSSLYIHTGSGWRQVSGGGGSQNLSSVLSTGNTASGITIDLSNAFGTTSYGGNYVDIASASSQATLSASAQLATVTTGSISQSRYQAGRNADSVWSSLITDSGTVDIVAKNAEAYLRVKRQTGGGENKFRLPWSYSTTARVDTLATLADLRGVSGGSGISLSQMNDSLANYLKRSAVGDSIRSIALTSFAGRSGPSITPDGSDYASYYPSLSSSYSNPSWIFDLPWSKITGTSGVMLKSDSTIYQPKYRSDTARNNLYSAIANRLAVSDTTPFARKSMPAYSISVNNTNATADATNDNYRRAVEATYSGTPTFTGTAPSGSTAHVYKWQRVGDMVTLTIYLNYGSAGSSVSAITVPLPSDVPAPYEPTSTGAASTIIGVAGGVVCMTNQTTNSARNMLALNVNSGDTGWDLTVSFTSGAYRYFVLTATYLAQ